VKYHELRPKKEARPQRRRLGRGMGSGRGKTAGRGTKGQLARSGGGKPAPFIGGAFPLTRTMPHKKGFRSPFRVEFALVKVGALNERFADGATVTLETLQAAGLVKERAKKPVKLLSDGEVTKRLVVRVDRASAQARRKIEAAGGTVEETLPRKKASAPASGEEA
jgi:large subunit ribosomal protein L15